MIKKMKLVCALLAIFAVAAIQTIPVSAVDVPTTTVDKINSTSEGGTTTTPDNPTYSAKNGFLEVDANGKVVDNPADNYMQKVTTEEASNKIVGKLYEIVGFLQRFGIPFCVVFFIIALIYTVAGSIAKRGVLLKGSLAMGICVVCYTLILYAPEIVQYASNWLVS